ncbi:putative aldouronate transport system substrate-binding protein [Paenibacillus sp. UNC496MF]|uniref:extracellular solute-binding protein n=1 Tax=Paenibacillus sp. UNC496MF TaxID=1502753 RepID=UPI0008E528B0|nr:extracellular solute-binding protein [Paenibacillus sp. UNC496MF]SFI39462.1 putative aldouronate transport system substrate-binding protein [Paenibacillus sp. UNC496MF]
MRRRSARLMAAAAATVALLALVGCRESAGVRPADGSAAEPKQADGAADEPDDHDHGGSVKGGQASMTYWAELNGNAASAKQRFRDVPFFQEWQRETGAKLTFIQPPSNQAKEAINVLLASGELPDMIEYEWANFPGGPEKAIKDGYILRLNDAIDRYAPNLKAYLRAHPDIDKQIRTADGSYYMFPFVQNDDRLRTYQGPILRKDWLDELGLGVPETIDDWHAVLTAFKERIGVEAPLTFLGVPNPLFGIEGGGFVGAYGIKKGFYLEDGQVKYGPREPGYKSFLTLFRDWYAEGLIDPNFAAVDSETQDVSMLTGRSGASIWNAGAGIGTWLPVLRQDDPSAELTAAPYPVLRRGDRPQFGQRAPAVGSSGGVAISSASPNVEQAARLLDYGYGPKGHMLFNFGIEGVSYEMKDGYPRYTDLILNNPDKLAPSQALAMYTRASYFGPFVQDVRYMEQYYAMPEQKEAIRLWGDTDAANHTLPVTPKTEKENAELSAIMGDVAALTDEMSLKFMLGIEPTDGFGAYVEQLKSLGIDRAIEIQQTAYDRYRQPVRGERPESG